MPFWLKVEKGAVALSGDRMDVRDGKRQRVSRSAAFGKVRNIGCNGSAPPVL
jgi:hypothetical protein